MARLLLGNHIGVSLDSVRQQFEIPLKKTPYNLFRGKHWNELDAATQELVADGACDEAESIWQIFCKMLETFPPTQLEVVDILIRMFVNPVLQGDGAFFAKVWEAEAKKKGALLQALNLTEADLQSSDRFAELLRAEGVEPEMKQGKNELIYAFAKNDDFLKNLPDHENETVSLLAQARLGVKSTIQQTRAATLGWTASRGNLPVYIRAYGAKTTRPSGGDGSNYLNMKKADPDMPPDDTNTNLKGGICAPPGYLLAEIDAAQIECVAENQKVLTEHGPKAIQDVKLWERVWDGQAFVAHSGVICKGIREVISYQGLTVTPTHVIYPRGDRFKEGIEMRDAAALGLDIQAHNSADAICKTALQLSCISWLQNLWRARPIQKAKVYDIINCGPRHRFMVENVIVSNCRILNEVAGQHDVIEKFRNGEDVYSTVASAFYGYPVNKKDHPNQRQLGKVVELQAGYMSGGEKIRATLRTKAKILITAEEGVKARDAYRDTHPAVVNLWKQGGRMISQLAGGPPTTWGPVGIRDGCMWLPNGCPIIYTTLQFFRDPDTGDEYWRIKTRKGWEKTYSGKLVENLIQALAWNYVSDVMVRLHRMGYRTLNCPYDALLILIPRDGHEQEHLQRCKDEMLKPPPWLPNLPLGCDGELKERYG